MSVKNYFSFVPNTITSLNAVSGALSVIMAFEGNLLMAGIMIFVAAVFDYLDGFSARILKAYSPMGKELDSLADMVSFGLAPSIIAHRLLRSILIGNTPLFESDWVSIVVVLLPLFMVALSALRLAKFNIDTRQTESFIGLNTPSNAMVWASFPIILFFNPEGFYSKVILNPWLIAILVIALSLLLVSELPMFSLKFKNLKYAENKVRFIFLGLCVILLTVLNIKAIPLIILLYLLLSAMVWLIKK